ncbi:hypothetical protein chiPu_0025769, partial [Chiloscyllium punctatum]|nr:hypothetical protein [Chiloscyllium punctatum]
MVVSAQGSQGTVWRSCDGVLTRAGREPSRELVTRADVAAGWPTDHRGCYADEWDGSIGGCRSSHAEDPSDHDLHRPRRARLYHDQDGGRRPRFHAASDGQGGILPHH